MSYRSTSCFLGHLDSSEGPLVGYLGRGRLKMDGL